MRKIHRFLLLIVSVSFYRICQPLHSNEKFTTHSLSRLCKIGVSAMIDSAGSHVDGTAQGRARPLRLQDDAVRVTYDEECNCSVLLALGSRIAVDAGVGWG